MNDSGESSISGGLPRRRQLKARDAVLVANEMSLRELRRHRRLTQLRIAEALGIAQDGVSRMEKRSDLLISTLRKTVAAMGGELCLVAEFPDCDPIVVTGFSGPEPQA